MAAPTPTARVAPTGRKLKQGYRSTITFDRDTNVNLFEKTTKPPGIDGGDPVDQTTMFNNDYRTMAPRELVTLTPITYKAAYDPVVITELLAMVNIEQTITETFPDGSTVAYYGYLRSVEFDELVEGTQPECTVTVVPTNYDFVNNVEAGPAVAEVAGT